MSENPSFTIDAHELEQAVAALRGREVVRLAGPIVRRALRESGKAVQKAVRREAAPHRRSGSMRGKIRYRMTGGGIASVVTVRAGGPVAHLVIDGFAPHPLTVKDARAMTVARGGAVTGTGFATSAMHPGYRGDPFFARGVDAATPAVNGLIDQAGAEIVAAMAREVNEATR